MCPVCLCKSCSHEKSVTRVPGQGVSPGRTRLLLAAAVEKLGTANAAMENSSPAPTRGGHGVSHTATCPQLHHSLRAV